jgi:hypothetical protein
MVLILKIDVAVDLLRYNTERRHQLPHWGGAAPSHEVSQYGGALTPYNDTLKSRFQLW